MLRDSSGFYSYAVYEHLKEWPGFSLGETRIAFKLRKDKYSINSLKHTVLLDLFSLLIFGTLIIVARVGFITWPWRTTGKGTCLFQKTECHHEDRRLHTPKLSCSWIPWNLSSKGRYGTFLEPDNRVSFTVNDSLPSIVYFSRIRRSMTSISIRAIIRTIESMAGSAPIRRLDSGK